MPGLKEAQLAGWFNGDTGELFSGFPIGAADTVVDVGCGPGGYSGFCGRRGARLILTDVDPGEIDKAKET